MEKADFSFLQLLQEFEDKINLISNDQVKYLNNFNIINTEMKFEEIKDYINKIIKELIVIEKVK